MMLSEVDQSGNGNIDGNSSNGQLLRDIEEISKALYLNGTQQKALTSPSNVRSKSVEKPRLSAARSSVNPRAFDECRSYKDKKSPVVWNWKKPLKALSHIRHQKFNICFFLHVHSIEGLPPNFNDINLSVHWKRKDEVSQTRPSRVLKGIAEFDDTLMHKCCIYGSRSGPNHSAKYEPKLFMIYASVIGAPGVDMGKHWVDLTRVLPLTLDELEGEKSTGKWTTSFKLAGKAQGATLSVSFGFLVTKGNLNELRRNMYVPELVNLAHGRLDVVDPRTGFEQANNNGRLRRVESVPSDLNRRSPQSVGVKICDDVTPRLGLELSKSIDLLYQKLNEKSLHNSKEYDQLSADVQTLKPDPCLEIESDKHIRGGEHENIEFTVIERGIEIPKMEPMECEEGGIQDPDGSGIEIINMDEIIADDIGLDEQSRFFLEDNFSDSYVDEVPVDDCKHEENVYKEGSNVDDLESALNSLLASASTISEPPLARSEILEQKSYMELKPDYKASKAIKKSHSLDDIADSVASDFLSMLGIEHSPLGLSSDSDLESPRERLLREFEKDALSYGDFIVDHDEIGECEEFGCIAAGSSFGSLSEDFDLSLILEAAEEEHWKASQLLSRRKKAKALEDLETEALMRQWGLNETAFLSSPCHCPDGFGSPVELIPEDPLELPSLGDGFGSLIRIKDGGCLRSMNPSLFRNSKNVGSLIMQVSRPVVLPAEMGSDIMEILQHLASVGIEKLSMLTNKLLPLDDITGRTLQQVAADGTSETVMLDSISDHCERLATLTHESSSGEHVFGQRTEAESPCSWWFFNNMKSILIDVQMDRSPDYVTLEDLAPLAISKIEDMVIEGLRIQSGLPQEEAPSTIKTQSVGKMPAFEGRCADLIGLLSSEGVAKLEPLEIRDGDSCSDGLLGLSITLDEWLRLDSGIIGDEDQLNEHTVMVLAAHHAKCTQILNGKLSTNNNWDRASDREHGFLGNSLTLALKILLRDPFRNYEPVGTSMLALIQLERASFHPQPKVPGTLLHTSNGEKGQEWIQNEEISDSKEEEEKDGGSIWFKITEVHLSGLNTEPGEMQPWGSKTQQQSGTRWLLASGLSKPYKLPRSKSKAIVVSNPQLMRKMQTGEILWSISSQANGTQTSRQELATFVPQIRNPDIVFPKSRMQVLI